VLLGCLFATALASCAMPDVPPGEKCLVWNDPPSCLCVDAQSGVPTRNITLDECTKYIAISPQYSEKLDEYVQELINMARRRCR